MTLLVHYPFDGSAADATGNGNDGTVSGASSGATGILGTNCFSFDGTDDYVEVGDLGIESGSFTIGCWFNTTTGGELIAKWDNGNTGDRSFTFSVSGGQISVNAYTSSSGSSTELNITGDSTVNDGNWHHAMLVFRSNSTTMALFVDGLREGGESSDSGGTLRSNATPIRVGSREAANNSFDGRIDDARIYDHAVPANGIQYLYQSVRNWQYVSGAKTL